MTDTTNLVPLPEPDICVPFLSEVRKVYQGDYYRADKVLPLLKQWAVLYSVAKAGHERAFAEAQIAATATATKDAEIESLRLDAARYRWLRDSASVETVHIGTRDGWSYHGTAADAAIDAAMKG